MFEPIPEPQLQSVRAATVWPVLVGAAVRRETITYRRLAQLVDIHPRILANNPSPLTVIGAFCEAREWPPLTVIVVSQTTGEPRGAYINPPRYPTVGHAREAVYRSKRTWLRTPPPGPHEFQH